MGALLSINVGMPKEVSWQGKTVFTAVFKDPVSGLRRVGRLNVDGDGQGDLAGHGGEQRAVFVYQIDAYRYWERELGRSDFVHGQFGENFTVEALSDNEVCIGDSYLIGTALFEVTQPRVTCYRVGIRMNDARIPALLVSHRRPGFYFRVLEEGEVQAGDEIFKVASGREEMTVAEVDGLLYLPGHPRQQMLRALRIPALSPGWRASIRALLDGEASGGGNSGAGYYRISVKREHDGTASGYLHTRLVVGDQLDRTPSHTVGARRARAAARCRAVPVRPGTVHGGDQRRPGRDRPRRRPHPHRAVRTRTRPDARHCVCAGAAASPTRGRARTRPDRRVRAEQPRHPVERRLREPARTRRGVRRPRSLVVPHRRLPQLRDDGYRGRVGLRPRPRRTARRRQRAHLLRAAVRRRGARSLTSDGGYAAMARYAAPVAAA
jgi:MOSC domain-containing protein YiiM